MQKNIFDMIILYIIIRFVNKIYLNLTAASIKSDIISYTHTYILLY